MDSTHLEEQKQQQNVIQIQKEEQEFEHKEDRSYREQDSMLSNEFSEMDSLQSSQLEADLMNKAEETEDKLNTAFDEYPKKKIKSAKKGPKVAPTPKYVSLNKSFAVDADNDSEKMQAVKEAINRYQEVKGTDTEGNVLATVIAACNQYLKGKFSLFKFGRAAERLREVKAVRENARMEMQRLKEAEDKFDENEKKQRRKDRIAAMKKKEDYYAPELNSMYQRKAESMQGEDKAKLKAKIKGLQFHYPAMDYDEAAKLVVRLEVYEHYNLGERLGSSNLDSSTQNKLDELVSEKARESAEKKRERDLEKEEAREKKEREEAREFNKLSPFEKRLRQYNPFFRVFMRTFGRMHVQTEVLKEQYMAAVHASGMTLAEAEELTSTEKGSRLDDDSTFI